MFLIHFFRIVLIRRLEIFVTNALLVMKVTPPEEHLMIADPLTLKDKHAFVINVVLTVIYVTEVAAHVK